MSLRVWLPLNGDLKNKGLDDITVVNNGAVIDNNGKIGKCYSFDGTNDYINITNVNYPDIFAGSFSICFWIYSSTDGSRDVYFGNYGISGSGNWLNIEKNTSNQLRFWWNNGAPNKYFTSYNILNEEGWTHVTLTRLENTIKVYKNGIFIDSYVTNLSNNVPTTATMFSIGGDSRHSGDLMLGGKINDFRIYDHTLSLKQIQQIAKGLVLHYKLDNDSMGGENLALNTRNLDIQSSKNNLNMYVRSAATRQLRLDGFYEAKVTRSWQGLSFWANQLNLTPGTKITYSFYIYCNGSPRSFSFYPMMFDSSGVRNTSIGFPISIDGGSYTNVNAKTFGSTTATSPEYHYVTFEWNQDVTDFISNDGSIELSIQVHGTWNTDDWACLFAPKVEYGDKPTLWSPARIEKGDSNIIYDSSGYQNNGTIIGNIQTSSDSPKYAAAANFDGASAIKVIDNNWVSQGMRQMTINLWIKPTTSSFSKFFSCTESGGWNTQSGKSGYIKFPIHVYTNQAQTSTAYKYDSMQLKISDIPVNEWSMITLIYDETGTRTYINSKLHHTYSNVSYGIHYNLNARLFLGCEATTASPAAPYFTGQQNDFRIYATALSAEDIKELYQTPALIDRNQILYVRELVEI